MTTHHGVLYIIILKHGINQDFEKKLMIDLKKTRIQAGRDEIPSAGILDSQSVKTTDVGGDIGYNGGKLVKGRKRHISVDVLGLIIGVFVTPANNSDNSEAEHILDDISECMPRLIKIWCDGGYKEGFIKRVLDKYGWEIEVIKTANKGKGFHVRPWCWIVERTFAWIYKNRRMSKDYERLCSTSENLIYIAMIRIMVRRLAQV